MRGSGRCIVILAVVMALGVAGCGSSKSGAGASGNGSASSTAPGGGQKTRFAKTKFVLHSGLAFGAFHRYIYKPFKAGSLGGGLLHNKKAKLKAALAAVFAYHEVKLALKDARSSPLLSKLLSPLLALQTKLTSLRSSLRHGDTSQVPGANSDVSNISQRSAAAGQPIQDQPTPSLGG